MKKSPNVAIIYDRANTKYGGAEHVLASLHTLYPDAPLYTSVYDRNRATWASTWHVIPSFLQKFPLARRFHRFFLPLMPLAFESFQLDAFDLIISVTSAEAKGVLTKPHQLHICYLLTPPRYVWSHQSEYRQNWLFDWARQLVVRYLKWWEQAAALRPDYFIPISESIAQRCLSIYHRTPQPSIYPPVPQANNPEALEELPDTLKHSGFMRGEYYLVVARLVRYKRIDLAIAACQQLGRPLVIIGDGPEYRRLSRLARRQQSTHPIKLIRSVHSHELAAYYKNAQGFLAPGIEDFGISSLEASSYGVPSVLHQQSGSAELLLEKHAAVHIIEETVSAVSDGILQLEQQSCNRTKMRKVALSLSPTAFEQVFSAHISTLWSAHLAKQQ